MEKLLKVAENIKKNNMSAYVVENSEKAVELVKGLISENDVIASGGSVTLVQSGVYKLLKDGNYNFLRRETAEDVGKLFRDSFSCDVYFSSCNAVTENGVLYSVDGNSNRIAAQAFGPKKVIFIVGKNKIVKDIAAANIRVKTVAAPTNAKRLGLDTYCAKMGKCVSFSNGTEDDPQSGCDSDTRICCSYLALARQRVKDRITVILVNEDLGF